MRQLIFRKNYYAGLKKLPDKERLEAYDAIMEYAFGNKSMEVSREVIPVLSIITDSIYNDFVRFEERARDDH